ncbi:MAG: sensor histidine kinase [Nitrososphaeraceae archaeon]
MLKKLYSTQMSCYHQANFKRNSKGLLSFISVLPVVIIQSTYVEILRLQDKNLFREVFIVSYNSMNQALPCTNEHQTTIILEGNRAITKGIVEFYSKVHSRCDGYAVTSGKPLMLQSHLIREILSDLKNRGVVLRQITEITKDNVSYCKQVMEIVDLRHLDYVSGGMEVSDTEYMVTVNPDNRQKTITTNPQVILSNAKQLVRQQQNIFDVLWSQAIPADQRIREIEGGVKAARIDIIHSPDESMRQAYTLLTMARNEVMISLPTSNSLKHLILFGKNKTQGMQQSPISNPDLQIRILVSKDERGDREVDYLKSLFLNNTGTKQIDIRILNGERTRSGIGILLVDSQRCLTFEIKDETKDNAEDAIGLCTYSDSKTIVSSHVSIFESLWIQTEMYQQLKLFHKMQEEFISTTAHELGAPVHPILMSAESLIHSFPNEERVSIILRNAQRLQRLANDILYLTRIENNTLNLKLERVDLHETIFDIVTAFRIARLNNSNKKNIKISYEFNRQNGIGEEKEESIFVRADKSKLTQVIFNLISNAIKFVNQRQEEEELGGPGEVQETLKKEDNEEEEEENTICISLERNDSKKEVIVNIKDTGNGIDPKILPRLFSKFTTKSFEGIGLGLYICKGIIEAHSGEIWAKNNDDEGKRGATLSFSLPSIS